MLKASAPNVPGADRSASLLLWPLLQEGPLRLRELAAAKGVDQSTVSRQAAQLVQAGLGRRDPDPADRRACRLVITERGRRACQAQAEARRQGIEAALAEWSDERLSTFVGMFRDFNQAVEDLSAAMQ